MRETIKKVYYCDYCGKRMFQRAAMEKHERHCTANINRVCKFCEILNIHNDINDILNNLFAREHTPMLQDIKELTQDCPACTLTILRAINNTDNDIPWKSEFNDLCSFDYQHEAKKAYDCFLESQRIRFGSGEV